MSISDAGPMNPEDLETARMWIAKGTSLTLGLGMELLEAHDYYRARCPVLASDVGPEHTAARVLVYALANGWTEFRRGERYVSIVRDRYRQVVTLSEQHAVPGFCGRHAKASGMAPLDVLAAIGSMP